MFCTVFTATYNRAREIKRLYYSLCNQTDKDFEWVVVDDGSHDETEAWFEDIKQSSFPIIYKRVNNGGKHRAINAGLDIARGKVFAIVDSDDYLTENGIETLKNMFDSIESQSNSQLQYCGVAALKVYDNGKVVGSTFDGTYVDAKSVERERAQIAGDRFEVFYTNILRNYKFPSFEGETFMTEAVVWYRLSRDGYYIRWFNEPIYICEYMEDGLSNNINKILLNNPKGYILYIKERLLFDRLSLKERMGYLVNYYDLNKSDHSTKEILSEVNETKAFLLLSMISRRIYRFYKNI
jgi:glycosyltransferase involved in cell wall biosynthesis